MKRFLGIVMVVFVCFLSTSVLAEDITEVIMISPEWEGFTDKDGTGLYNEIMIKAFKLSDITVVREYAPFKRCWIEVNNEKADFYTCETRSKIPELDPSLVFASSPMYEGKFHAFFKKDAVDAWEGQASIEGKKVVWRMGYYSESDLEVKVQKQTVSTGVSAMAMVIKGRADFYLDDKAFIQESVKKSELAIDMNDYRIEEVGFRGYYPVFKSTERGKKIMEMYERGVEQLYRSGELAEIYEKAGHPLPSYYAKYDEK